MFACALTSVGVLGIVSSVTLRCVPRFQLRRSVGARPLSAFLDGFGDWANSGEHVSASWLPWTDVVAVRSLDVCADGPRRFGWLRQLSTTLDEVRCGLAGLAAPRLPGV